MNRSILCVLFQGKILHRFIALSFAAVTLAGVGFIIIYTLVTLFALLTH